MKVLSGSKLSIVVTGVCFSVCSGPGGDKSWSHEENPAGHQRTE